MMRRVYLDFIRQKAREGRAGWLLARAAQYALIKLSHSAGRPLTGPALGTLLTNYRCNFHCRMCDMPHRDRELKSRGLREFTADEMKGLIHEFAALGTPGIGFTGGEPLLRPDIFELMSHAKKLGMITHLNTNGYLLAGDNIVRLFSSGVDSLNISLDGATARTHDEIRGVSGAFEHVVAALSEVDLQRRRRGSALRIKTVAVLDEGNLDGVPALVELARSLGADCMEFIPRQPFRAVSGDDPAPARIEVLDKVSGVASYLASVKGIVIENSAAHLGLFRGSFNGEPSPIQCYAGYNSLGVDCYGEIYPCVPWMNWQRSVGNVVDAGGLGKFWYSDAYNRSRPQIASCRSCHLNCQSELNLLFNPGRLRRRLSGTVRHR